MKVALFYSLFLLEFIFIPHSLWAMSWESSFERASKRAKQMDQPMFVDFYTDWCGWCKKLDREVYSDTKVDQLSQKFICIKVNCERDRSTAERFRINGYPTMMFLSSEGNIIRRIDGYVGKTELVAYMKEVIRKTELSKRKTSITTPRTNSVEDTQQNLVKAQQFYQLAQKMEKIGRKPQAINFYSGVIKAAPGSDLASKAQVRIKQLESS